MTDGPELSVVTAGQEHVEAAWGIIDACRAELHQRGIVQWDDVYPTRQTVADDAARGHLFVLVVAAKCVATVTLDESVAPEWAAVPWQFPTPALVVHRLCVNPMRQGQGYGRTLMDFSEAHAAAHGYASIRLDAYSPNSEAIALYRRRGYREAGLVMLPRHTAHCVCFERAVTVASRPE